MSRSTFGGLVVESDLDLAVLDPASGHGAADIAVRRTRPLAAASVAWAAEPEPGFLRTGWCQDVLVLAGERIELHVDGPRREVRYAPGAGVDDAEIVHGVVDHALPLLLGLLGRWAWHGVAVEVAGAAVVLLATSGGGKSTLALAAIDAGHRIMADDCVLFEASPAGVVVVPTYPGTRAWPDTVDALAPVATRPEWASQVTGKRRLVGEGARPWFATSPAPVAAVVVLDRDGDHAPTTGVRATRLVGGDAVAALLPHAFAVTRPGVIERRFDAACSLAASVDLWRISYRSGFEALARVVRWLESLPGELRCPSRAQEAS